MSPLVAQCAHARLMPLGIITVNTLALQLAPHPYLPPTILSRSLSLATMEALRQICLPVPLKILVLIYEKGSYISLDASAMGGGLRI